MAVCFINEKENLLAVEEISGTGEELSLENASVMDVESQPLISEERQNDEEEDNDDSAALKKPRLIWTDIA